MTPDAIQELAMSFEYGSLDRRKLADVIGMLTNTPPEYDKFPYDSVRLSNLRSELGEDTIPELQAEIKYT